MSWFCFSFLQRADRSCPFRGGARFRAIFYGLKPRPNRRVSCGFSQKMKAQIENGIHGRHYRIEGSLHVSKDGEGEGRRRDSQKRFAYADGTARARERDATSGTDRRGGKGVDKKDRGDERAAETKLHQPDAQLVTEAQSAAADICTKAIEMLVEKHEQLLRLSRFDDKIHRVACPRRVLHDDLECVDSASTSSTMALVHRLLPLRRLSHVHDRA